MEFICSVCPRQCGALRSDNAPGGVCRSPSLPRIARAAPHFGEEPCISGTRGAGAVFFTGCNLRCVFCQNHEISRHYSGKALTSAALADVMLSLRDQGVHNINLVTATHYARAVAEALRLAKLDIPVVWNSSGYESVETLKMLDGLVQIYMPDYKYAEKRCAERYSSAPDYPEVAAAAIKEMFRQRGKFLLDDEGLLKSGVLIRHLILPGNESNSLNAVDFVADTFEDGDVLFSLMSQYTPMPGLDAFPELSTGISAETNDLIIHYMKTRGIENGYWQERSSATENMIPAFDMTGLQNSY